MIDRTTKALLLAIALGLWMGLVEDWMRPTPVSAQSSEMSRITLAIENIATGYCRNSKIC